MPVLRLRLSFGAPGGDPLLVLRSWSHAPRSAGYLEPQRESLVATADFASRSRVRIQGREGIPNVGWSGNVHVMRSRRVSTPGQNLTLPPDENLTDRRGDEPQFVAAS